jgi:hypothetical protein
MLLIYICCLKVILGYLQFYDILILNHTFNTLPFLQLVAIDIYILEFILAIFYLFTCYPS